MNHQAENNVTRTRSADNFLGNMGWDLANTMSEFERIANGTLRIADLPARERLRFAEHCAQASGILMSCSYAAREINEPQATIDEFESFATIFAETAHSSCDIANEFDDDMAMTKHLQGIANNAVEYLHQFQIDVLELHATALVTVKNSRAEYRSASKNKKKWWHFGSKGR